MSALGGKRTLTRYADPVTKLGKFWKSLWRWFVTPSQMTPASRMRDLAWALWLTPTIMLIPFWVLPLLMNFKSAMQSVLDAWWIYLFFFALPYAAGALIWMHARRIEQRH